MSNKSYGKYRGLVTNIKDPEKRGRIKVSCPKIYGDYESPWCLPCMPFASDNGGMFKIPSLNEMVWLEFEEGDPNYPIVVGGLWQENKTPLVDYKNADKKLIIKTDSGQTITIDDAKGRESIKIEDRLGSFVLFDSVTGDITLKAKNNILIEAKEGDVTTLATKNVSVNAGMNYTSRASLIHKSEGSQVHHN